jgi:hypothetical protein
MGTDYEGPHPPRLIARFFHIASQKAIFEHPFTAFSETGDHQFPFQCAVRHDQSMPGGHYLLKVALLSDENLDMDSACQLLTIQ